MNINPINSILVVAVLITNRRTASFDGSLRNKLKTESGRNEVMQRKWWCSFPAFLISALDRSTFPTSPFLHFRSKTP